MNRFTGLIFCVTALFFFAGCGKKPSGPPRAAVEPCSLISAQDIQEIQGAPMKDVQPSMQKNGRIMTSQCYFAADPSNRSVSLSVTQSDPAGGDGDAARDYWTQTFKDADKARPKEEEEPREKKGEEGEEKAPVQKISGLGDEAFWSSSRVGGALYVLKKDLYIRISLGGPDDEKTKIEKSSKMAQRVLDRL